MPGADIVQRMVWSINSIYLHDKVTRAACSVFATGRIKRRLLYLIQYHFWIHCAGGADKLRTHSAHCLLICDRSKLFSHVLKQLIILYTRQSSSPKEGIGLLYLLRDLLLAL